MAKLLNPLFFLLCIFSSCSFFSQNNLTAGGSLQVNTVISKLHLNENDIFGTRNFIENKGQFENPVNKKEKVLFVYEHGDEKIYFTAKGLIYDQVEHFSLIEEQKESREHEAVSTEKEPQHFYVKMNWVNPDQNATVEKSENQGHYFTYGSADLNSYTYKKITYKNIYKNIDIVYSIPSDKETGIKYSVILHPNADVRNLKILYTGDVQKIRKNGDGGIIVKAKLNDIVEHAPLTFYSDNTPLESAFNLRRDTIGFIFPNGLQQGKTVIVDPWVGSITTLTTSNSAFDVDYDYAGNTFIYGGSGTSAYKIAMYNPGGVLQWTFSGVLASPVWNNTGSASNFGVDKFNGKSYTGQGVVSAGAQVIRLDIAGNYDNFITVANGQYREIWDMGFHCQSGEVFVFGGSTAGNLSAATINSVNATLTISTFQPLNVGCCQDVVSYAIDDQGDIYVLYASASNTAVTNRICLVNSTFNGNVWTQPTGYTSMNENNNKSSYQPSISSNGFNSLAVSNNYVYYYDGLNLGAYSKLTGINAASLTITGMTLKRQGGIAVDDCDNIYLGGNGSILTYSFNGTTFSTLTPISLGVTTATQNVQDIKLDRNNNILYVCGTGFVGTYSAALSNNCPISGTLAVSMSNATTCPGQSVTLTASGANSYTWSNGITTPTISVSPTVSSTYTVSGKNVNSCGSATGSAMGSVTVIPGPTVTVSPLILCKGEKRTLTATGANTYSWNTGASTSTIIITPTVNTVYTVVCTSTASPCTLKKVVTVTVAICKGVADYVDEQKIARIYPNPVKDKLNIELIDPSVKSIDLSIYNSLGQLVYSAEKMNFREDRMSTIDLGNLPKGLYFISIQTESLSQPFRLVKD